MDKLDKVIRGLKCIVCPNRFCGNCIYFVRNDNDPDTGWCDRDAIYKDALELLKTQEWISVKDKLPTEHDTIFAKLKGTDKWKTGMFEKQSDDVRVVCQFEDGTRRVWHDHTVDGVWDCEKENKYPKRTVTHWCENPQLPEV